MSSSRSSFDSQSDLTFVATLELLTFAQRQLDPYGKFTHRLKRPSRLQKCLLILFMP